MEQMQPDWKFFERLSPFSARGANARSGVLTPLVYMAGSSILLPIGLNYFGAPQWMLIWGSITTSCLILSVICGWIFFAINDPSKLHSEKFLIERDLIAQASGRGMPMTIDQKPSEKNPNLPESG